MNEVVAARSPAGFWKRYVAYFIDVVLVYAAVELLNRLFFSAQDAAGLEKLRSLLSTLQNQPALPEDPTAILAHASALLEQTSGILASLFAFSSIAYVVVGGAYFALCESSAWQATLGKRLIGIKVTDASGSRIGLGRAVGRFFAAGLSWLTLNLGHAMAALAPEHRALHDYVAGTRVENTDPSRSRMPVWGWLVIAAHALVLLLGVLAIVLGMALVLNSAGQS